jgi:hypothetical protein
LNISRLEIVARKLIKHIPNYFMASKGEQKLTYSVQIGRQIDHQISGPKKAAPKTQFDDQFHHQIMFLERPNLMIGFWMKLAAQFPHAFWTLALTGIPPCQILTSSLVILSG